MQSITRTGHISAKLHLATAHPLRPIVASTLAEARPRQMDKKQIEKIDKKRELEEPHISMDNVGC